MERFLPGIKTVHFVGIGGIGMTGLALLLNDKGYRVRGSDLKEGPNTQILRNEGIEVFLGHKKEQVKADTELVVYSSAVKEDNPEIVEAKNLAIPIVKRGRLLGEVCADKKTVAVAGSHGKTTTSALIAYILEVMGYAPAFYIGGIPLNHSRNAFWGGEYFVIETDESDGSFLYYHPWVSVITNIDKEHIDHYGGVDELRRAFIQFAGQTREKTIGCGDDPWVRDTISSVNGITYGFDESNVVRAQNLTFDGAANKYDLYIDAKFICAVKIPLLGLHNVLNSLGALAVIYHMGEDILRAAKIIDSFKSTKRRFQVKAEINGVTFVDDYGHHPTEIAAVLAAARQLKPKRVVVLLQPHRYSRVKSLYHEFTTCLKDADLVVVTDIYAASELPMEGLTGERLSADIAKKSDAHVEYITRDRLCREVPRLLQDGDICIALGAGDINIIAEGIADEFKKLTQK